MIGQLKLHRAYPFDWCSAIASDAHGLSDLVAFQPISSAATVAVYQVSIAAAARLDVVGDWLSACRLEGADNLQHAAAGASAQIDGKALWAVEQL